MHIEILVEDSSGQRLLNHLLPKILPSSVGHRIHPYRGIGALPRNLKPGTQAKHQTLLNKLPALLQGYSKVAGVDAVVLLVDSDGRNCKAFLEQLQQVQSASATAQLQVMFRLAIEEIEAWYLGDQRAILQAYPKAKSKVLEQYQQDSVCGTWELLLEAVYPGGMKAWRKGGAAHAGDLKHEWAEKIGPLLDIERNQSPSFCKFRDGLRRLCIQA